MRSLQLEPTRKVWIPEERNEQPTQSAHWTVTCLTGSHTRCTVSPAKCLRSWYQQFVSKIPPPPKDHNTHTHYENKQICGSHIFHLRKCPTTSVFCHGYQKSKGETETQDCRSLQRHNSSHLHSHALHQNIRTIALTKTLHHHTPHTTHHTLVLTTLCPSGRYVAARTLFSCPISKT